MSRSGIQIPGAKIIPAAQARSIIAPLLAPFLPRRDLDSVLDDELVLADPYDTRGILTLPDGTRIDGDLELDWEVAQVAEREFRGVLALGTLDIVGDIRCDDWDGGPFLATLGPLHGRHIFKRGATLLAFGPLDMSGTIYCEYNHGSFRALGGVRAQGMIIDGHDHQIVGPVNAVTAVLGSGWPDARDPRETLLPEFFLEEDGEVEPIDDLGAVLQARIKSGKPVFRDDAPRGQA
jgi:hypothetical protein